MAEISPRSAILIVALWCKTTMNCSFYLADYNSNSKVFLGVLYLFCFLRKLKKKKDGGTVEISVCPCPLKEISSGFFSSPFSWGTCPAQLVKSSMMNFNSMWQTCQEVRHWGLRMGKLLSWASLPDWGTETGVLAWKPWWHEDYSSWEPAGPQSWGVEPPSP